MCIRDSVGTGLGRTKTVERGQFATNCHFVDRASIGAVAAAGGGAIEVPVAAQDGSHLRICSVGTPSQGAKGVQSGKLPLRSQLENSPGVFVLASIKGRPVVVAVGGLHHAAKERIC